MPMASASKRCESQIFFDEISPIRKTPSTVACTLIIMNGTLHQAALDSY